MAIKIGQEFERTSKATRFKDDVMTKAQMLAGTDDNYSDGYLVVEKDSHDLYIYDSNATPSAETGKFVKKGPEGNSLPDGGTTGQILAKNSDDDGDAGWIVDTGKDLNKLVTWGANNSQSPITEYVPTITDSTADPYHRAILHIPIQGSALQGIEATEESLKQCLKTRFKIRYATGLSGTSVFTTTAEDTAGDGSNSFGMKTNLISGYDDSRLYIYLNETTISDNTLHLAVSYYVHFTASQTNHHGKPANATLIANDGYTFGVTPVGEPYYVHNSTKIALDDLQINDLNIPTSWGVAKTGNLKMYMTNKQSYQYLWFGNLGFSSVDDYVIFVDITGGMEAAWGKPTVIVSNKSATEAGISLECDSAEATWFNVNYVIIGKGYGNITSGGGGNLPAGGTTGQALVKKSDTDGDVEWKTVGGESTIDKIEVNGVEQPIVNKTVDLEVPKVSMQGYDNISIMSADSDSGFVFNANTDNVTVTTETGTRTLPTKTYVDSKSPTIVNEGATFTNALGNQKMQIRTGGTNSVIIKDINGTGTTEYWSYELPDKTYVDTELAKKGNTITIFDNEYKTFQTRDVSDSVELQVVKETSNDYIRVNEYAKDDRGQMQQIFDVNLPTKTYVDNAISSIPSTTVDQNYDATSTNAQSGVAVAQGIVGTCGDLTQLNTTAKTDLVEAVNEVFSSIPSIDDNLNTNSGNPVQNKVITNRLNNMSTAINGKQATLVSGTNIKTVDGQSLLGSGNVALPTIVGSNWGVAKTGDGTFATNISTVVINISDLNLSSVNDYDVFITATSTNVNNDTAFYVTKTNATSFTIGRYIASSSLTFRYVVVAKGYGSVPKGGTTGQVLAKKSSADGDVEWVTGGGGGGTGTVDQTYDPTSVNAQSGTAVAQAVAGVQSNLDTTNNTIGDLTSLTTTTKTDIVSAINDVDFAVKNIGEPFRVVNWASNTLNVQIVPCTSDTGNTSLAKMIFTIDNETGAEYQIVGMIAYEVFDAESGGNRINCWPVCQFTGNGQKELSVRWMCGGTTNKVAKRINAWVLLKHR